MAPALPFALAAWSHRIVRRAAVTAPRPPVDPAPVPPPPLHPCPLSPALPAACRPAGSAAATAASSWPPRTCTSRRSAAGERCMCGTAAQVLHGTCNGVYRPCAGRKGLGRAQARTHAARLLAISVSARPHAQRTGVRRGRGGEHVLCPPQGRPGVEGVAAAVVIAAPVVRLSCPPNARHPARPPDASCHPSPFATTTCRFEFSCEPVQRIHQHQQATGQPGTRFARLRVALGGVSSAADWSE